MGSHVIAGGYSILSLVDCIPQGTCLEETCYSPVHTMFALYVNKGFCSLALSAGIVREKEPSFSMPIQPRQ